MSKITFPNKFYFSLILFFISLCVTNAQSLMINSDFESGGSGNGFAFSDDDYPHYFTPNGDGLNDVWNITSLSNQPESQINIFNREGKLIKKILPSGEGWDGTFNGELLPATDYWFTVDFKEQSLQKQFKSHFSLKR